jgi:hypothetical protein
MLVLALAAFALGPMRNGGWFPPIGWLAVMATRPRRIRGKYILRLEIHSAREEE